MNHFISVLLCFLLSQALPASDNRAATRLFADGKYAEAQQQYRQLAESEPGNPLHPYNLGCTAYAQGDWEQAARHFDRALETTDLDLQADSFYNLGNTAFRQGQDARESDPDAAIEHWESALSHYQNTLELRPDDANAAYNARVVEDLLQELREQQEQQQEQGEEGSEDEERKEEQEGDQQQSESGESGRDSPSAGERDADNEGSPSDQMEEKPAPSEESESDPDSKSPNPADREITSGEKSPGSEPDKTDEASATARPMQMSPREAEQLLESLRQTEKKLPVTGYGDEQSERRSRDYKDW